MSHDSMFDEHRKTYTGFVKVSAASLVLIVVVLALMGIFLV